MAERPAFDVEAWRAEIERELGEMLPVGLEAHFDDSPLRAATPPESVTGDS